MPHTANGPQHKLVSPEVFAVIGDTELWKVKRYTDCGVSYHNKEITVSSIHIMFSAVLIETNSKTTAIRIDTFERED